MNRAANYYNPTSRGQLEGFRMAYLLWAQEQTRQQSALLLGGHQRGRVHECSTKRAGRSQMDAEQGCTLACPLSIVGRHLTDDMRDLAVALPS